MEINQNFLVKSQKKIKAKFMTAKTGVRNPKMPIKLCSNGLMFGIILQIESKRAFKMHPIKNEYLKNLRNLIF